MADKIDYDKQKKEIKKLQQLDRIEVRQKIIYYSNVRSNLHIDLGITILLHMIMSASVVFMLYLFSFYSSMFSDIIFSIAFVWLIIVQYGLIKFAIHYVKQVKKTNKWEDEWVEQWQLKR